MTYQIEISKAADKQLKSLSSSIQQLIEKRISWLAENADSSLHHRLKGMPDDLAGLCRFRVSDYRILYWLYPEEKILRIYKIMHRSEVYKGF